MKTRIAAHIEQLQTMQPAEIHTQILEERLKWLRNHANDLQVPKPVTPRFVFETLFFKKMGLDPSDLPVVSESDSKIVWLSKNPCVTLEACKKLGLDTRKVCREINEEATQAFVSWFDPDLRFGRDYHEIRPYADYCKEWIVRVQKD